MDLRLGHVLCDSLRLVPNNQRLTLLIDRGGHNWPNSQYQINQGFSILKPINEDINTAELIWEFFNKHSL